MGRVVSVGDGIARIYGLNEILVLVVLVLGATFSFPHGKSSYSDRRLKFEDRGNPKAD